MAKSPKPPKEPGKDRYAHLKEASKKTQFQPGNSGHPGRPRIASAIREMKGEAKNHAIESIIKTMMMTQSQLDLMMQDPTITNTQRLVASLLQKAIDEGCFMRAQFLFNYILGKPMPMEEDKSGKDALVVFRSSVRKDGSIVQQLLDETEGETIIAEIENIDAQSGE